MIGLQTTGHFDLRAVGDPYLYLAANRLARLRVVDHGIALLPLGEQRAVGEQKDVVFLLEDDQCVGRHVGQQKVFGVLEDDPDFERDDPVGVLKSEGRDARHESREDAVLEAFHSDSGQQVRTDVLFGDDAAYIDLIDLTIDVQLAQVTDGHDGR